MSMCTSAIGQIWANATLPSFELSATTTHRRAWRTRIALVLASTSSCVVQPAELSIPSTPTKATSRL
jgi:hypothetical protein